MLRRNLAFTLALGLGFVCAACSSSDGEDANGGEGGSAGQIGQDAAPPEEDSSPAEDAASQPVSFTDSALESCVRTALQKSDGDLFPEDLAMLDHLECQDQAIASLAGLEHATGLLELSLFENAIEDLAPLAGLTQLRDLRLGNNAIQDISPLSELKGLRRLGLGINQISSLQPLSGLTSLEWLNLDHNAFGEDELTQLAGLTKLRWLTIEFNGIEDHSSLQPILDAGCQLYDQHEKDVLSQLAAAPTRPSERVFAKLSDLTKKLDATGVTFSFPYKGKRLPVHATSQIVRKNHRLAVQWGGQMVEVGRIVEGEPLLCEGEWADTCQVLVGTKWPGAGDKGLEPIVTVAVEMLEPPRAQLREGEVWTQSDMDLEPLALASPNQFDAGSCLFMANTGVMEILMNQHVEPEDIQYQGDTDLSERFLMGARYHAPYSTAPYWLTDTLEYYGAIGGALLNRDYNFCVGYVKDGASTYTEASPDDPNASLSCGYNWLDKFPEGWESMLVSTPDITRTVIFTDPKRDDNSQWRVALFDGDTIERIKYELRTKNAPVIVIYNHFGYWHANVIVGYDDTESSGGCGIVRSTVEYFNEQGGGYTSYADKISEKVKADGGCSLNGVFYVRDSIYEGGEEEPMYDYTWGDASMPEERYSKRITKLSYNWARYLANHAYTVHRK